MAYGLVILLVGTLYVLTGLGMSLDWPVFVLARRELGSFFYSPIAYLTMFGFAFFSWFSFLAFLGPRLGIVAPRVLGDIAGGVAKPSWWLILLSGMLAAWLMGLLSWLVAASRDTIGQILIVWMVTFAIGFAPLHHAVVGSTEVLAGVFAGQGADLADYWRFLGAATAGNILGGFFFVAVIKYGHAHRKA